MELKLSSSENTILLGHVRIDLSSKRSSHTMTIVQQNKQNCLGVPEFITLFILNVNSLSITRYQYLRLKRFFLRETYIDLPYDVNSGESFIITSQNLFSQICLICSLVLVSNVIKYFKYSKHF